MRNRTQSPVRLCFAASTLALLALTGCTNPSSSAGEGALYANSQSNLVSLTEVVDKYPDDPQAGYMARVAREILPAVRSALGATLDSARRTS